MNKHIPRKRFGQHFLRDPNILRKIVAAIAPQPEQHIVEIGPGEGVLTALILPNLKKMDVIEIDRDLVLLLQNRFKDNKKLQIHQQDVLKFDWHMLTRVPHALRIVGNLPYNISSPLLFKLFSVLDLIYDMHFMLQKEVVLRMTAEVGAENYNRLSVMTQYYCQNERLFDISPAAFYPPPKVDSAIVRMTPRTPELVAKSIAVFSDVVRTAFNQRRKTLHNCLKTMITSSELTQLNIDNNLRPQRLTVNDFVKIANFLYDKELAAQS